MWPAVDNPELMEASGRRERGRVAIVWTGTAFDWMMRREGNSGYNKGTSAYRSKTGYKVAT